MDGHKRETQCATRLNAEPRCACANRLVHEAVSEPLELKSAHMAIAVHMLCAHGVFSTDVTDAAIYPHVPRAFSVLWLNRRLFKISFL